MKTDTDFDEELSKSIESIIEDETSEAESDFMNQFGNNYNNNISDEQSFDDLEEDEETDAKTSPVKVIIIVLCTLVLLGAIGGFAYYIVKSAYNKSMDNYGYYNENGYKEYDNKNYEKAAEYFEKALTYSEGSQATSTNINMMLYLYECYSNIGSMDKGEAILKNVLSLDPENENAIYYLVTYYDEQKNYSQINDLYNQVKDSDNDTIKMTFAKFLIDDPIASPEGGEFTEDKKIYLSSSGNDTIYYTIDGTNPNTNSSVYSDKIEISSGKTTIKFMAVNEYGFESNVVSQVYDISYVGPGEPKISPSETSFTQSSKVMVTISDYDLENSVYYTLDGTQPTTLSKKYSAPFELPDGTTKVTVMVMDKHNLTCTVSKTYSVTYIAKYTEEDGKDFVWGMLKTKGIVDDKHINKNDDKCTMEYLSKKNINGKELFLYEYFIDEKKMDYWYAADASSGEVYMVTKDEDGKYKLFKLKE